MPPPGTIHGHGHPGDGDNPPQLGNGATFSHRAVTFGDHISWHSSTLQLHPRGMKPPKSGTPKLSGMESAMERTLTPWEGQPAQAEEHQRQKR